MPTVTPDMADLARKILEAGERTGLVLGLARELAALVVRDTTPLADRDDLDRRYVQAAQAQWERDGEIEIDDDASVSMGADDGAYVQAWVWVSREDVGDGEETDVAGDMEPAALGGIAADGVTTADAGTEDGRKGRPDRLDRLDWLERAENAVCRRLNDDLLAHRAAGNDDWRLDPGKLHAALEAAGFDEEGLGQAVKRDG